MTWTFPINGWMVVVSILRSCCCCGSDRWFLRNPLFVYFNCYYPWCFDSVCNSIQFSNEKYVDIKKTTDEEDVLAIAKNNQLCCFKLQRISSWNDETYLFQSGSHCLYKDIIGNNCFLFIKFYSITISQCNSDNQHFIIYNKNNLIRT